MIGGSGGFCSIILCDTHRVSHGHFMNCNYLQVFILLLLSPIMIGAAENLLKSRDPDLAF